MLRLAALLLAANVAQTSTDQSEPAQFEAASIRPTNAEEIDEPSGCLTTAGLMRCTNVTLKRCIVGAYGVGPDRVLGGSDWINTERFQITARSDQPVGDKGLMAMLQTLLAERFKLVLHRELRHREAMVLQVAKNGPKLQPGDGARASWKNMHDRLEATKITMGEFAEILSRNLNLPVVDRTGLTGAFNFTLYWNPDNADALQHDEGTAVLRSEMSTVIARQLGLVLMSRKMSVEILVIDHAEKPSENRLTDPTRPRSERSLVTTNWPMASYPHHLRPKEVGILCEPSPA
jgi:uncharacterized protein (TIGR03435 family)